MPKIIFLPHPESGFLGKTVDAKPGQTILEIAIANNIPIDHACEGACACTTCHVLVRKGLDSLSKMNEREEDLLDNAWGLEPCSRLSCQALLKDEDLIIEIPKYSRNLNFNNPSSQTEDKDSKKNLER